MRLVWADECEGAAGSVPDPQLWRIRQTDRWQSPAERQVYTTDPANAHYDGRGHLVLTAIGQAHGWHTSGKLSAATATFLYGRFEAHIKIPTGGGIWPAWWLLGPDHQLGWPHCGEIDIMEAPSSPDTRGQIHQGVHAAHTGDSSDVAVGVTPSEGAWGAAFHIYRLDWLPQRMDFYVDKQHTGTVTRADLAARGGSWPFDDLPHSPMLNVAVGGWAGVPDTSWISQSMLVSYVRIFA